MRPISATLLIGGLIAICHAQEPARQPAGSVTNRESGELYDSKRIHVTCKPAYYLRSNDRCLVPAAEARLDHEFAASGIVFTVVTPEADAGKVISFHFDFPEKWNRWYKPEALYEGTIDPR